MFGILLASKGKLKKFNRKFIFVIFDKTFPKENLLPKHTLSIYREREKERKKERKTDISNCYYHSPRTKQTSK